jgi:FemAB-related protein (PEP-CTERM system-associated)
MADKALTGDEYFLRTDSRVWVRPAGDSDQAAWDAFVLAHPAGSFFHRFAWRDLLRRVFDLAPRYLIAERDGAITGVLPLVHQKSRLFGDGLIAVPFCVEGGPLGDDESVRALDAAALAWMGEVRAPFVEYRSCKASRPDWITKTGLYARFVRPLASDDDTNLKAIPRKQRAVVRKAMAGTLTAGVEPGIDAHYRVYGESLRNLGTPMFPRRWFSALRAAFGADCDVVVIRDRGEPVSAVMNFYHNGTVLPYYGGGTVAARKSGANDLMYWETMRHAARRGCTAFDFGRSKAGTGAFAFKKNWGFEPEWLEYEYYLSPGSQLPEKNPNNPKYATFIAAWKKLPLPLANFLGPFFIRGLG